MDAILTLWQVAVLTSIVCWVASASFLGLTRHVRAVARPWVTQRVIAETPYIVELQKFQHKYLDTCFCVLSCVVSVPFYTGFLPIVFWSGHSKLAWGMTLLVAFCDYLGNSVKDVISAPRPSCPPVRRVTATKDEEDNAQEFGLPSSHVLNTICLAGYLLHYIQSNAENDVAVSAGLWLSVVLVLLIGVGRIYLGMHCITDVVAGVILGLLILAFSLTVHEYVDDFIVNGENVVYFWACLSVLLFFAYPTPEFPTPSYEYHTAFNGVAFGIVVGVHQTYQHFHSASAPRILTPQLPLHAFVIRVLIGIPTILLVKFCCKALAKWLLPMVCNTLGIPIYSSCYVPTLKLSDDSKVGKADLKQQPGFMHRMVSLLPQKSFDVDTGIRFLQYAGLAWSVTDLVPSIFHLLSL